METRSLKTPIDYIPGQAVNGIFKQDLLKYLGEIFNLRVFYETGCCQASTLLAVKDSFDELYSIELSDHYYKESKNRIAKEKGNSNITLYPGNSAKVLREILFMHPTRPALFWLDSHFSGGKTANEGDPLPDEIKAIMELSPDSLVVIDDEPNDERVKGLITQEWTTEFRTGIVFLYRKGLYNIPEFE